MANKLVIILHNSSWQAPESLLTPLFQGSVAAAMQYETEIILCGRNTELAEPDKAAGIPVGNDETKTLYDYLKEAFDAGAAIKVCSATHNSIDRKNMIPEIQEVVGAAYILSEAMDPDTVTFTY